MEKIDLLKSFADFGFSLWMIGWFVGVVFCFFPNAVVRSAGRGVAIISVAGFCLYCSAMLCLECHAPRCERCGQMFFQK